MRWYLPSWNGDFRFEPEGEWSKLTLIDPTPFEHEAIGRWAGYAEKIGWLSEKDAKAVRAFRRGVKTFDLRARVADAASRMAEILNYERAGVLHAFGFQGGQVKVVESLQPDRLPDWARSFLSIEPKAEAPLSKPKETARAPDAVLPPEKGEIEKEPEKAVTVRRPTLSCPECSGKPERDRMPCDVLWEFLTDGQRRQWQEDRSIVVTGGLTGHPYLVSARDTEAARRVGRTTIDVADQLVLHNYDWTVPPEEEVLGVKLILEHRENWLRVWGEVDPIRRASPGTVFGVPFGLPGRL